MGGGLSGQGARELRWEGGVGFRKGPGLGVWVCGPSGLTWPPAPGWPESGDSAIILLTVTSGAAAAAPGAPAWSVREEVS